MINKSIESSVTEDKGKIIIRIDVLDKKFEVVKLYLPEEKGYDQALEEAQKVLSDLIADGIPQGTNRKVKYLIDERTQEQAKELHKENQ